MNDLTNIPTHELAKEIERRNQQALADEQKRLQDKADLALRNIDTLLSLVPNHSRTSCHDGKIVNGAWSASNGGCRCVRCFLIEAKRDKYWNPDFELDINLTFHLKP